MSAKSPRHHQSKKTPAKTLKQKRAAKKAKRADDASPGVTGHFARGRRVVSHQIKD